MNASSLIELVTERFPEAVSATHTYRGDETVVLRREYLLEVARFLKEDPDLKMNFLMDLTAVDYSTFGQSPAPAFFASSGVAVSPSEQIPDKDPWPGPPAAPAQRVQPASPAVGPDERVVRFVVVYHFYSLEHKHRLRLVVPVEEAARTGGSTGSAGGGTRSAGEVDSLTSLWAGADWLEREVWDMFGIRFRGHPNLKRILMYEEFEGHPLRKDYPVNKRQPLIGPVN